MNEAAARAPMIFERTYGASIEDVWDLWTTKDGIESWWGPAGFAVTVQTLDVRPGGEFHYTMTAVGEEQVAYMRASGMQLSTDARVTYTEVVPHQRLAYVHVIDFIPNVEPYEIAHLVQLEPLAADRVQMTVTIEGMHDEEWKVRAAAGWQSQIGKLDAKFGPQTEVAKG